MAQVEAVLPAAATEPPATTRRSIPSLFIGMALKPRSTLAYLRDRGGHTWIWPALAAIVLTLASQAILVPIQRAQIQAQIAEFQQQQGEQGGQGTGGQGNGVTQVQFGTPSPLTEFGLPVGLLAGGWLVRAGLLYGLSLVLGGKGSLGAMARMSLWTTLPDMARTLIVTTVSAITGTVSVPGLAFLRQAGQAAGRGGFGQGAGGFTAPSFPTLFVGQLLSRLDIYTVWGLILLGLGVAITARLSTLKAIIVTGGFWAASLALAVVPQLLGVGIGRLLGGGGLPGGGRFVGPGGGGGGGFPGGGGGGGGGGAPPDIIVVPGP